MNLSLSIAYHIMFQAEKPGSGIDLNHRSLIGHISQLLENKACHIYAIGGRGSRVNMLISLDPKVALAELLEEIMDSSEALIKNELKINGFRNRERDYWAYTHSTHLMDHIIDFIMADDEAYQEERRAREAYLYHRARKGEDLDDDPFFDELYFMDP